MFEDRIVLITGAASGIGLETTRQFISQGARVIGFDVDNENLQVAHETLGDNFFPALCDISNEKQISSLTETVSAKFERIDVLVNNAGRGKRISIENMKEEDYYYHYEVLIKGPMLMVKHYVPLLRKSSNPSIINISSLVAQVEFSNHFLYSTAKAAIEKYTKHLVRDLPGIRSNAILPGCIDTPIFQKSYSKDQQTINAILEKTKEKVACGRIGKPEDIANCILFLASEKATYINGASILIDGGLKCGADWGPQG